MRIKSNWKPLNFIWHHKKDDQLAYVQLVNDLYRLRVFSLYGELEEETNHESLAKAKQQFIQA